MTWIALGSLALGAYNSMKGGGGGFFGGSDEEMDNISTLLPGQQKLLDQALAASQGQGAGGAFGESADFYRDLMSNDSQAVNAFAAPEIRKYNEDIVPGLSEQFAGMGAGGLSSSGFRNAQVQGATDLSERLGAIRAALRMQGAQGLQSIGQVGLGNYSNQMTTQQGTPGFMSQIAPAVGNAAAQFAGQWAKNQANQINGPQANQQAPPTVAQTTDSTNLTARGAPNFNNMGNSVGLNSNPYGNLGMSPRASPMTNMRRP